MTTRTVLIPLDGSPFSRRALVYVRKLFDPTTSHLVLMRVGEEPVTMHVQGRQPLLISGTFLPEIRVPTGLEATEQQVYASQLRENIVATLEDELRQDALDLERAGYQVTVAARCGDAAKEINRFVSHHGIDVTVMATHGRTGLRRLALGSVATDVVRHSSVPVLLVPPVETQEDEQLNELLN